MDGMKQLVLAILLCAPLPAAATAQTSVTGFNPRFSASSDFPDEPDHHQPSRPPSRFDIGIDVEPFSHWERDRCRDRRDCRRRHRD
jgi:hypothetical protein